MHLFLGALVTPLAAVALLLLGVLISVIIGRPITANSAQQIIASQFFPVQGATALVIAMVVTKRKPTGKPTLTWAIPSIAMCVLLLLWSPSGGSVLSRQSVWSNFFRNDDTRRTLDQWRFTLPFACSIYYSIGAGLRSLIGRSRGIRA